MVDVVHGLTLEEQIPVKAEFRNIHGAPSPVTVSRSGRRWDGYERDELLLGDLEVECSIPKATRDKTISVPFDPESSYAYLNYKATISEMAGLVYKWPQLHRGFMDGMAGLMKSAHLAIRDVSERSSPKLDLEEGASSTGGLGITYVSSNQRNLNHKDIVRRHGF